MISRKPKLINDDAMKTLLLTPSSSVKSSTTTMEANTFYFPGCKKDANCSCEICIASINATLDLMPRTNYRSSLTKLSVSRRRTSPVSFPSSVDLSTPKSTPQIRPVDLSPPSSSTESSSVGEDVGRGRRKRGLGFGVFVVRFVLGLILVWGLEFGVSMVVSRVLEAKLDSGLLMNLGVNLKGVEGLDGKFVFLENELEGFVGKKVSSCGSVDSVWKINQDGLLLNSRCVLYKSMTEEVSIWGWPLQTAGLLTADYSSRSFAIISGRVTEWSNGEAVYFVRTANGNSSWTQEKWSSSVVQLDPSTWILEYRRSFLMDNAKLVSTALDFLKFRLTREFEKFKQEFWLASSLFGNRYFDFTRGNIAIPT